MAKNREIESSGQCASLPSIKNAVDELTHELEKQCCPLAAILLEAASLNIADSLAHQYSAHGDSTRTHQ